MTLDERMDAIEVELRRRLVAHMAEHHPGVAFTLQVFDSDNGDDDWLAPMAATMAVPALGVEDAYGLCDAGVDTVENQAEYLFSQIMDEFRAAARGRK